MPLQFAKVGLGYVMAEPSKAVEIEVQSISRSRGDWVGMLSVSCGLVGVTSSDGRLHYARHNLSSGTARSTLARSLKGRANLPDLDWEDLLEQFCRRVLTAQSEGEPIIEVGDRPQRLAPRWTLDPLIAHGKATILFGQGGSGKSTLAVAIAVSVQTGITVIPGFVPVPSDVLYLDWETDPDDVDEKVKAIAKGAGIDGRVRIRYRLCGGPFADQVEEIGRYVDQENIGLIIVDSVGLAAGMSSDGGDAAETAFRLFGAFRLLGRSVLAVDHVSKADANEPSKQSNPYGSVYKAWMARAVFELRRSDGQGNQSALALYNTKLNVGKRLAPIALTVEHTDDAVTYGRDTKLDPSLIAPLTQPDKIAWLLREHPLPVKEIAEALDLEENKVRAVLSRHRGRFAKGPSGDWGLVSHAG